MATYNSSSITRDGFPRGVGVYPIKVIGTINLASNITLGSGAPDVLPICLIPSNSFISDFKIGFPAVDGGNALGLKLVDTLASPTTYIAAITQAQAGGTITMSQIAAAQTPNIGAMYAATSRTIGATGAKVLVWTSGVQLQLSVITSATNTSGATALNITYMVEFAPVYDAGT